MPRTMALSRARLNRGSPGPGKKSRASNSHTAFVAPGLLSNILRRLDVCRAATVVCRLALGGQQGECDPDIALVLQGSITSELERQIERIRQITGASPPTRPTGRARRQTGHRRKRGEPPAIRIGRTTLDDIRARLSLVRVSTLVCKAALLKQNVADIASALEHCLIAVLQQQIDRIATLISVQTKTERLIAGVAAPVDAAKADR